MQWTDNGQKTQRTDNTVKPAEHPWEQLLCLEQTGVWCIQVKINKDFQH